MWTCFWYTPLELKKRLRKMSTRNLWMRSSESFCSTSLVDAFKWNSEFLNPFAKFFVSIWLRSVSQEILFNKRWIYWQYHIVHQMIEMLEQRARESSLAITPVCRLFKLFPMLDSVCYPLSTSLNRLKNWKCSSIRISLLSKLLLESLFESLLKQQFVESGI